MTISEMADKPEDRLHWLEHKEAGPCPATSAGQASSLLQRQHHLMRIVDIRERTAPISSPIANAFIDFSKMTLSLVAVVTDVIRDGKPVIGYGFNSNGRYGQGGLIRERFAPRVLKPRSRTACSTTAACSIPHKVWAAMFTNEKPGGHGERSVAIGTIDMAVWDAVAKIAGKPLFRLLAERQGTIADPTASSSTPPAAITTPARASKAWRPRCRAISTAATTS